MAFCRLLGNLLYSVDLVRRRVTIIDAQRTTMKPLTEAETLVRNVTTENLEATLLALLQIYTPKK